MGKENFIPLSQANNSNLCEGRLRVNLPLPYGLDERIEIDTHRMDVLRQMAGFGRIILTRDDESGTSQVVPQIDGINIDGTATARKAKIKIVPEANSEFKNDNDVSENRANWPNLNLKLNIPEIQQRLLDEKKGNIHDQKLWAEELDRVFKNTITKAGVKHLLSMTKFDIFSTLYMSGLYSITTLPFQSEPIQMIGMIAGGNIFWNVKSGSRCGGFENKEKGYRISLMFGPEIERAVVLSVYSRIGSVIRAKAEEKK